MEAVNSNLEDYAIITHDKIRYCDTDRQGHVNNAVFSSFFETGRVEILYNNELPILGDNCSFVIASIKIDYSNEISWPGTITIGTMITKIGNSSIGIEQGLFQDRKCVAKAETVIVQMNETTRKSESLSDEAKNILGKYIKTEN